MNTKMTNAEGDLPVERVGLPEHFASEADATHLYVPKSAQGEIFSSLQPRVALPFVEDNSVRNHATVVVTTSAALVDRQRSWRQLQTMAAAQNDCAAQILEAVKDFVIE
jgi:hypothetical protein